MSEKSRARLSETLEFIEDFPPQSYEEWKNKVLADLKGKPFEKLITKTYEGVDIQPLYVFDEVKEKLARLPLPGEENFIRGTKAAGNVSGRILAQTVYAETPEEFNRELLADLKMGLNSVNVKLKNNLVPKTFDDYFALEIKDVRDLETLLDGVNIEEYPFFVFSSFPDEKFTDVFGKFIERKNFAHAKLYGAIECDPVNEAIALGALPSNEKAFDEILISHFEKVKEIAPNYFAFNVKANNYANAGGGAVCELTFALASAVRYFDALNSRFDNSEIAKKIRFTFALTPFFFADIAKLRAFKALWRKVTREFGIAENDFTLNVLGESSTFYRTVAEPYANMLRATAEAFGGIIGGADAINILPFDAAFRKPDAFSRRMARNSQIILDEESALNRVIDAGGGSYFLETLTEEFAEKAWKLFQKIESADGIFAAAEKGIISENIEKSRSRKFEDFAKRKFVSVGINAYVKRDDEIPEELAPETKADALAENFDLTKHLKILDFERLSARFENLRRKVLQSGAPKVELVALGKLSQYKARADFSRALFETAAFEVVYPEKGNATPDEAAAQIINSENKIFVICSDDETYKSFVCKIAEKVNSAAPEKTVLLAGKPKDEAEKYATCGVSDFIYAGMNALEFLTELFNKQTEKENE